MQDSFYFIFFFEDIPFLKKISIYLAVSGLSCGTRDLR